MHLITITTP